MLPGATLCSICNEIKVLVVDDNYYNYLAVRIMLKRTFNMDVAAAENGEQGYAAYVKNFNKTCCNSKFDMILMDL
jgi:CheY-like chemotaxis protein